MDRELGQQENRDQGSHQQNQYQSGSQCQDSFSQNRNQSCSQSQDSFSQNRETLATRNANEPPQSQSSFAQRSDTLATRNANEAPAHSPPPGKCEASTMMSTAFLKRQGNDGGVVKYQMEVVNEECQVSSSYADCSQDKRHERDDHHQRSTGMSTYDEVGQYGAYGMITCDEPIVSAPNIYEQHHHTPAKPRQTPRQQAPPGSSPVSRQASNIDMSCSNFSQALTSVSRQAYTEANTEPYTPSNVGSSAPRSLNVGEELKMREAWAVGSILEVFSSSAAKWYIAQLAQVGETATAHMITVQFVSDNGQIMQKSMPRSDVQLATFGRNTRQMPPNFQKVGSESRPGQFSYQDSATGQKYQTKELAWENYYRDILKSEQAQQLLRQQSLTGQPPAQTAPAHVASDRLKVAAFVPPPTMSLAPAPMPPMAKALPHSGQSFAVSTVGDLTPSNVCTLQKSPSTPFPGYGQSFAVGTNAGYEAYLASQGMA